MSGVKAAYSFPLYLVSLDIIAKLLKTYNFFHMKKLILLLILVSLFLIQPVKAQNWAPDGAEWYYDYTNFWYEGYIHIKVLGDTMIHDTSCRVLEKRSVIRDLLSDTTYYRYIGKEFMFSDVDKVYLFANNKFYPIYDFSSMPGDTLIIPQNDDLLEWCDPEGKLIVTDTGSELINGQHLRKIIVQPIEGTHWAIYGEIIENIGPINTYMLPEPDWACVVDLFEGGPLRCYSDPDFGTFSTGIAPECDYLVSIQELDESNLKIFPNPCVGNINIHIKEGMNNPRLEIYNSKGQKLVDRILERTENIIDLSSMVSGLYALVLMDNTQFYSKLIVVK